MAEENITTSKVVYGAQSANEFIDKSFTELFKTKDPVNISRFFSMYDELFYSIPQTGDQSHTTLIDKSQDYVSNYQNPLQVEVDSLREEVIRLTEQLNETEEENPFYSNGTLLAPMNTNGTAKRYDIFYMDRGLARKVVGNEDGDAFKALKASLGFSSITNYDDIVLAVPESIINNLERGSKIDIEDIVYPKATQEEQRLQDNIAQQNQISIDTITNNSWWIQYISNGEGEADRYKLINEVRPIIENAIRNAWKQERQIEILRNKYLTDIQYGYTEEERTNGQILLDQLLKPYNKLRSARDTLVRYRNMWALIKPGSLIGHDIFYDIKSAVLYYETSDSERNELEGKWNDENFSYFFPELNLTQE